MLADRFDRALTGIRVSLTDRCNFDCVYCHNEGLGDTRGPMAPREDELGTDEVVRVLDVAADVGVDAVKLTGGEPMLREDLEAIVRRAPDALEVSMTTNGVFLPDRAEALAAAGLERVNVSRDAIDPAAFADLTNAGASGQVFAGIDAAREAGLDPVKLNAVVFEQTAHHIPDLVEYVASRDELVLQLIEFMPELVGSPEWAVEIERVHDWLSGLAVEIESREMHDRTRYHIPAGAADATGDGSTAQAGEGIGIVEIVDPVGNEDFCANCHRVRVTPEGHLMGCLNRPDERVSLGECSRKAIREAFETAVAERVPYYGEYMTREDGEWVRNPEYADRDVPTPSTDD
ncbi:GTP 3',8-cyclase MoaA [Halorhabdus sp. CBA1104]|uniref:GTP 3',8-cyclase MoaA n=1 Tax=unclassified Halorhabdus TaxID=2621901 RepID=UPI0012B33BFA|nr:MULTISPECIES: GTP 3',8-cyclase MoaA [unclassified Halorhabdus]QGN07947.1 GTP 3',8-cyclase MoaA [Halorhabdus sp. CBA1104]